MKNTIIIFVSDLQLIIRFINVSHDFEFYILIVITRIVIYIYMWSTIFLFQILTTTQ